MRKTTGLLSVLVLGAAVAGPVASAHAAPATASAASACHRLVIKANASNNKALSADNSHSYKKAIGHNKATQKYLVQATRACRHARHAAEIRRALDGARGGVETAEHHNKRAYAEHDSRAGRAAAHAERDAKARLRIALHHS
ncbi:hypothetical protein [Streptomyces decoyicus]|uniref:hypothetical protein n=1 Tax=Streptomyces decoyicus TaxID=249567 RepID=UPI002E197F3B|nr:hypothetical protein OG532_12730 [Streptomyces decoyicus]